MSFNEDDDNDAVNHELTPEETEIALEKIRAFVINPTEAFKDTADWTKPHLFYRQRFLMYDAIAHRLLANCELLDESDPRLDEVCDTIQEVAGAESETIPVHGAAFALGFNATQNCIRDVSKKMMFGCIYADFFNIKIPEDILADEKKKLDAILNFINYYGTGMCLLVDYAEMKISATICDPHSGLTDGQIKIADEVIADNTAMALSIFSELTDEEMEAAGLPSRLPVKEAAIVLLNGYTHCGSEAAARIYAEVFERPQPHLPQNLPTTTEMYFDERPKYLN